jgi:AcrR family transcriptional regulator
VKSPRIATGRRGRVVDDVLRATAQELARVGYAALRVDDVAQVAGVNKTTIYRRWPTKAHLVSATLRREGEAGDVSPDSGSLREDLLIMLRSMVLQGKSPMLRVLVAEMTHPEVHAIGMGLRRSFESRWVATIARGMARGELPADTSPLLLTEVICATVMRRIIRGEEPADEEFCETVLDLVLAGASARGRRRPRLGSVRSLGGRPQTPGRAKTG